MPKSENYDMLKPWNAGYIGRVKWRWAIFAISIIRLAYLEICIEQMHKTLHCTRNTAEPIIKFKLYMKYPWSKTPEHWVDRVFYLVLSKFTAYWTKYRAGDKMISSPVSLHFFIGQEFSANVKHVGEASMLMFFHIQQKSSQQHGPSEEITTAATKDLWHFQTTNQKIACADFSGAFSAGPRTMSYPSTIVAEGKNLMMKLERDQIQITPRNWRTFRSVLNEPFIAKFCAVISAPLTVKERAVTSCAALFSWCSL